MIYKINSFLIRRRTKNKIKFSENKVYLVKKRISVRQKINLNDNKINIIQHFAFEKVYKIGNQKIYQAIEVFTHNLNTSYFRAGIQILFYA